MRQVDSLLDIVEAVKKTSSPNEVLVSQHETSRSAVTLGDEDTEAGTRLRVKALFNGTLYYSEEFQDDTLYEEAIDLIKELENYTKVKIVSEAEIEKLNKMKEGS
ncbi:MAG TPA: hypothetical protein DCR24_12165 [Bacillus bacterium]|nr:hypothetical protein [Bacillus sp. (in: firmicutes)]